VGGGRAHPPPPAVQSGSVPVRRRGRRDGKRERTAAAGVWLARRLGGGATGDTRGSGGVRAEVSTMRRRRRGAERTAGARPAGPAAAGPTCNRCGSLPNSTRRPVCVQVVSCAPLDLVSIKREIFVARPVSRPLARRCKTRTLCGNIRYCTVLDFHRGSLPRRLAVATRPPTRRCPLLTGSTRRVAPPSPLGSGVAGPWVPHSPLMGPTPMVDSCRRTWQVDVIQNGFGGGSGQGVPAQ